MRFLGVIPARAGSKRLLGKNLYRCADRPLIAWTCEAVVQAQSLTYAVTSTDGSDIAKVSEELGVAAPFVRPDRLSSDTAPSVDVARHAMEWACKELRTNFDAVVLLQPTSPLRDGSHIDEACHQFKQSNADTLVSVCRLPKSLRPGKFMVRGDGQQLSRFGAHVERNAYDPERLVVRDGPSILISRSELISEGQFYGDTIVGYEMPWETFVDIDELHDLAEAERRLRARHASSFAN